MQLFYSDLLTSHSTEYVLSKDESKHVIKVLRKKLGDTVFLTNGKGYLFTTQVSIVNPNKCHLKIISHTYQEKAPYKLHLAVAPTKLNDRYEWFLEKVTEIGVSEITPIICDHSERNVIKIERFKKIVQSAMKQSLHYHMPVIHELSTFTSFIENQSQKENIFIAHCEDVKKNPLKTALRSGMDCTILIGPEGDFSALEIEKALQKGYKPVSLGGTRLRTETAAIVACHSFHFINEIC